MAIRSVGPGKTYATIAAAVAAAADDDIIEIDGGRTYTNDGAIVNKRLTFRGVPAGTFARIDGGWVKGDKAYFVVQRNCTFEWIEFIGAGTTEPSQYWNWAGIRWEGGSLVVNNCYFERNGNGIQGSVNSSGTPTASNTVTITNSEFNQNGHPLGGAGTHHIYINQCSQLTIDNCYFHDIVNDYNQVKSRAQRTTIRNSRIFDLNGFSSYSIDCPDGGEVLVENCIIQQGANQRNSAVLTLGVESGLLYSSNGYTLNNNTFVNDYSGGGNLRNVSGSGSYFNGTGNKFYNVGTPLSVPSGLTASQTLTSRPTLDTTTKPWGGTGTPGPDPNPDPPPGGRTLTVGPGKTYSTIRQAIAAAATGDVIEVDGGRTYTDDGGAINGKAITIRAVPAGSFARVQGQVTADKGYFVCGAGGGLTLEWFELIGASEDGSPYNAAGVRMDQGSGDLTLRNCYLERNGNGVLCGVNSTSNYKLINCEFNHNGHPNGGAGTHHFYCNDAASLTVDNCYFHDITNWYNQVKSRARFTTIRNCRVFDLNGESSYSIDTPDGGVVLIDNCVVQQGTGARNRAIFTFGVEGGLVYAQNSWTIRNSVIINDLSGGADFISRVGGSCTIENCQVYLGPGMTMPSGSGVVVTGVTFLNTRPTLDTVTKPWAGGGGPTDPPPPTGAITVGANKQYATLSAAISAAPSGSTILVDAGTYTNDFSGDGINKVLTIKGVGGFARLVQTAATIPNAKGILVPNQDMTLEWIEFVGAKLDSGDPPNAAGVRHQGGVLTCRNCWFHDCQNGILANTSTGSVVLEKCEFNNNGGGEGRTHNIYVNNIALLSATDCYFHEVNGGNEIKSRAKKTVLTRTRVFDFGAFSNYTVDCPDGGRLEMTDCVLHQGAAGTNGNVIETGAENAGANGDNVVVIANTTFVNSRAGGATFYWNASGAAATITNTRLYVDAGAGAVTMNNGAATVTGTQTLTSRPTLDTSHPWESVGTASMSMSATGVSDAPPPPGVDRVGQSSMLYGNRSTHTISKPAGVAQGHKLIMLMSAGKFNAAPVMTPPAGWTAIGTNPHAVVNDSSPYYLGLYAFEKVAGASEPATYSSTSNGACDSEGVIVALTGADPAVAAKVSVDNTGSNGTPSVANSVTLSTLNAWVAHVTACWNTASGSTPPANYTERFEGSVLYLADRKSPANGATGSTSANHPNNVTESFALWASIKVAVEAIGTGQTNYVDIGPSASMTMVAAAVGRMVKDTVGTASAMATAGADVPTQARGDAFAFFSAQGVPSARKDTSGAAAMRASATAFSESPGHQDPGLPQAPIQGPDRTLIGFGNWADDAVYLNGAWRSTLPLTNLATMQMGQLARTISTDPAATQFVVDLTNKDRPARIVALLNHNIRFSAKYRLRGSNSPDFSAVSVDTGLQPVWPSVYPMSQRSWFASNFWFGTYTLDDVKGYPWHLIIVLNSTKRLRYWWLEIQDVSNPDGYVQAGRLFIGDAWQPKSGLAYGFNMGWEDPTTLVPTLSGAKYPDPRPPYRVARPTTHFMETDEAYGKSFELQRRSGIWREVIYIHDINDTKHAIRRRFPARVRSPGPHENPYPELHQAAWEFEEILP